MRALRRLGACAAFVAVPSSAWAQAAAFNHWRIIDGVIAEIGGIEKVGTASPAQVNKLADNLLRRAQFYQDLYEYESVIVRDHALLRDSIGKHGGARIPAVTYFLGRGLQEMGRKADAAAAYRMVGRDAPAAVRTAATAWAATTSGDAGKGWEQDAVSWRAGKQPRPVTCPAGATTCNLFRAILADDAISIVRLQRDLTLNPLPDYRENVRPKKGAAFSVDFFDPLPLFMLAQADYALAAYVLKEAKVGEAARGIALLHLGRLKEAESSLRSSTSATGPANLVSLSLGEVLYRQGRVADAEQVWRNATGPMLDILVDVRSSLGASGNAVVAQYQADSAKGFARMRDPREGGVYLARALLREGRAKQAMDVLDDVRPASGGTNLNLVSPDVLVLISRARYIMGTQDQRDNFPLARGELAALANELRIIRPALKLLQEITAPSNVPDVRSVL